MKSGYLKLNKWFVTLIFAALVLAFFWKTVFLGYVTVPADILKNWYPWMDNESLGYQPHNTVIADIIMGYSYEIFVNQSFKEGSFPLWNPYIFSGTPFVAKGVYLFYPIMVCLQLLLSPLVGYQVFIMLHLFLMGIFMYLLMKKFGVGEFPSLITGIIWMFNGLAAVWAGSLHFIVSGALFPILVFTFTKSIDEKGYFYTFLTGFLLGLILISGVYIGYYVVIFLGMYAIFYISTCNKNKEKARIKKIFISFAVIILLGISLSMVELLPMLEFIKSSARTPRPLIEIFPRIWTNYLLLISFFVPKLFGTPISPNTFLFPGNIFNEFQGYMGALPLILAIFAAIYIRKKIIYFFTGMSIFSLALSVKNPLYLLFYYYLPGFNNLEPGRILFLYAFCVSVLAGFGLDYILSAEKARMTLPKFNIFWQKIFALILICFSILNISLYLKKEKIIQFIGDNVKTKDISEQIYAKLTHNFNILNPDFLVFIFIFTLSILLISLYTKKSLKAGHFRIVVFGLIIFDLFSFGINYNTNVDPASVYPKIKSLQLLQNDKSIFRVMSLNDEEKKNLIMPFNTKMPYRIQDIDGYDNMYAKNYVEFMGLVKNRDVVLGYKYILPSHCCSKLLNLLNVKYILAAPNKFLDDKRFELLHKDGMRIYRNNKCLPRAFVVPCSITLIGKDDIFNMLSDINFDPAKTVILEETVPQTKCLNNGNSSAQIINYKPNRVDIKVQMEKDGFLVLADSYNPGWQVFVNGKKDKIYRAYYILRAVYLNPGRHKVEFIYRPKSFLIGRNISILTFLLIILMIYVTAKKRTERK